MMLRNFSRAAIAMLLVVAIAVPMAAPSLAQLSPLVTRSGTVYRLSPDAAYTQGCFPPVLCPIMVQGAVRGTMVLTPLYTARPASTVLAYRVDDVNWLVRFDSAGTNELRVTGSGVFHRAPASEAQRLELDLSIDNQPVQHFDSGWVKPTVSSPQIDLTVSINKMVGFDTVFGVAAAPVPVTQIVRYQVDDDSTHQVGCWAPCECPLQEPQPLTGTFALVPIRPATASDAASDVVNEYAVVNVRWNVVTPASLPISYRGSGFYRRNVPGPWANPLPGQRMLLDLRTSNSTERVRFDSGVVPALVEFPKIGIAMSIHGLRCFDTLIRLNASPAW